MICGTSQMDGAVVVVAADDGCMPQTREHLFVCKQLGVKKIVGFVNKADIVDRDVLELVELELRDLFEEYKFEDSASGEGAPSSWDAVRGTMTRNQPVELVGFDETLHTW
ncbi:hypothetical protein HPB52_019959 [Rhipicephalus sanguineus]|uniref:Tr-type G domain-containing protein n=1 Tax=Rhipicephalus sanguineus TaxID=34632 RepID=A0A9D4SZX2_RHISA|nr:hypothetical protein HPB52_019959 [Rhipicephalus sanguineus]